MADSCALYINKLFCSIDQSGVSYICFDIRKVGNWEKIYITVSFKKTVESTNRSCVENLEKKWFMCQVCENCLSFITSLTTGQYVTQALLLGYDKRTPPQHRVLPSVPHFKLDFALMWTLLHVHCEWTTDVIRCWHTSYKTILWGLPSLMTLTCAAVFFCYGNMPISYCLYSSSGVKSLHPQSCTGCNRWPIIRCLHCQEAAVHFFLPDLQGGNSVQWAGRRGQRNEKSHM